MGDSIKIMGLVGTGVMGAGIAQIAAQAGVLVRLFDARDGAAQTARDNLGVTLAKLVSKGKIPQPAMDAALENLQVAAAIEALRDCDLVVEAIVENLEAKRGLLQQLEGIVTEDCILATNTSSLSVTAIATGCQHPERVAGLHFFNPVPLMRVVEVIDGLATAPQVGDRLLAFVARIGHRGVRAKDTPGFIVNHALLASDGVGVTVIGDSVGFVAQRTLAMVVNLACDIAQQRIASVEDIDQAVQLGLGYPNGPLAWGDALGPRRILSILQRMSELTHDPRYRPSPWLRRRAVLGISLRHKEPSVG